MTQGRRGLDGWLVLLATASLVAWSMLAFGGSTLMLPALCSASAWPVMPLSASFDSALVFNAPARLAWGWALMLAAMMLPLVVAPLRHVRERSFARRRTRAMLLFVLGYLAVWMAAGMVLQVAAVVALWTVPLPLMWLAVALAVAVLWQVSPAKQWCLNRCHRKPALAAFEPAADHDAFRFGLANGAAWEYIFRVLTEEGTMRAANWIQAFLLMAWSAFALGQSNTAVSASRSRRASV